MTDDGELLDEQRAFYRARASEYDEWWQRRGRYDRGEDDAAEWARQVAEVEAAWKRSGPPAMCSSSPAAPAGGPSASPAPPTGSPSSTHPLRRWR